MMGECRDCVYWDEGQPATHYRAYRLCTQPREAFIAAAQGPGGSYRADLHTTAEFGCNGFTARPVAPPPVDPRAVHHREYAARGRHCGCLDCEVCPYVPPELADGYYGPFRIQTFQVGHATWAAPLTPQSPHSTGWPPMETK